MTDSTLALTIELIRRPSVTPADGGCQQLLAQRLEAIGFRLAMLLLLPYLLLVLGVRNWLALGIFSLAGSFGVYHLFSGLLKVPLP